jgi:hypothetical protein
MGSNDTGFLTLVAAAATGQNIRVKLVAGEAAIAGSGDEAIGSTVTSAALGKNITVKLDNASGTQEVTAAGAVTVSSIVYSAANGQVGTSAVGSRQGIAITAASGQGVTFELLPLDLAS